MSWYQTSHSANLGSFLASVASLFDKTFWALWSMEIFRLFLMASVVALVAGLLLYMIRKSKK